jgi:hypothetical protein
LESDLFAVMHNQCIGNSYWQKSKQYGQCPILNMGINGAVSEPQKVLGMHIGYYRRRLDV